MTNHLRIAFINIDYLLLIKNLHELLSIILELKSNHFLDTFFFKTE